LVIFDANDVEYLINNFSVEQLRLEIKNAYKRSARECDYLWLIVDDDFISACKLAIGISTPPKTHTAIQSRESIDDIKTRIDLAEYVGQYVQLKKSGKMLNGMCPLHTDKKSKSFFVYPNQSWHCFGACNRGGTIIDFVMLFNHTDVKGAIEILAK